MRLMPINMCRPGMRLGKTIYNEEGTVLLAVNVELTQRLLERLHRYGIDYLNIMDSRSDDIIIEDVIQEKTRVMGVREIRNTFRVLMEDSGKKGSVHYYDIGRKFRELMTTIIEDLSSHPNAMMMLTNINVMDSYLYQHSLNVCIYTTMLGMSFGYNREDLTTLGLGALLHDIGKTRINPALLNKPANLNNDELEEMKTHTTLGFQILKDEPNVPLISAHCAFQHHERLDGSGYPRGIAGNEIHEYAKWIGLVDSYDAMTTRRQYRDPLLPHEAMEQLFTGSGTLYDQEKIALFRDKIAIYPLGMPVTLNTGESGIISDLNRSVPHRPIVRIFQDEAGQELMTPYEVDLSFKHSILITAVGDRSIHTGQSNSGIQHID
jgi:HD-GYP domain-containing protein (c-di-GMP phosphodiesterase class II)